jgi:hypothetical protein
MFHVVTSGRCWIEVAGSEARLLQPGDLTLVPHGEGHRLVSEPDDSQAMPNVGIKACCPNWIGGHGNRWHRQAITQVAEGLQLIHLLESLDQEAHG